MTEGGYDYKAFAILFVDDEEQARKFPHGARRIFRS